VFTLWHIHLFPETQGYRARESAARSTSLSIEDKMLNCEPLISLLFLCSTKNRRQVRSEPFTLALKKMGRRSDATPPLGQAHALEVITQVRLTFQMQGGARTPGPRLI
jgi:hypothetical protein